MDKTRDSFVRIHIKLFGHLRQISPLPSLEMETAPGCSILEVVQEMTESLGQEFRQAIFDSSGSLHGGIEIVLDEEHLPSRKLSSITIHKDCNLFILPMIEGGCSVSDHCSVITLRRSP